MVTAAFAVLFALLIISTAPERQDVSVLSKIPTVAKAITAGAAAFGSSFAVAYVDQDINSAEWVTIAVATVVALVAVWAVPNKPDANAGDA